MTKLIFEKEKDAIINRLKEKGVCELHAQKIADCLTTADAYGVYSHGKATLDAHINRINKGAYNLQPNIKVVRETAAFAVVDGDNSIGMVSADFCMDYAIKKSKESGIFAVFSKNNNTFGPAFYYPLQAAKRGVLGIAFSNSPAQMAPFGGKEKMLGTNPFAAVIPVGESDPIIIDFATSVVAKSKFKEYANSGKPLPQGWALDVDGNPTTDAKKAIEGLVLPMAGFKGYGIALLIDVLAGVMSGASYLNKVGRFYSEKNDCMDVGFCFIAIDPKVVFGDDYNESIQDFVLRLRNSEKIEGNKISLPGDDRVENYRRVCDEGITD